jgi:trk system potassium uptake protein TrkH
VARLALSRDPDRRRRLLEGLQAAAIVTAAGALALEILEHGYLLHLPLAVQIAAVPLRVATVALFFLEMVVGFLAARERRAHLRAHLFDVAILVLLAFWGQRWSLRGMCGLVIVRQLVAMWRIVSGLRRIARLLHALQARPTRILALSFLFLIGAGAVLLTLPAATVDQQGARWIDALFTATSASCVTGLVVVDTGTYWTLYGQLTILALIQIGGLGIMTLSTALTLAVGRSLGIRGRHVMQQITDEESVHGMVRLVLAVVRMTLALEGIGAAILYLHWHDRFGGAADRLLASVFHSVSAFCNAGFSLFRDNLVAFRGDWVVNLVIMGLIVLGGLGFTVVDRLLWPWRGGAPTARRLDLNARLVLQVTGWLLAAGTLLIFFLEYDATLAGLPLHERLLAAAFQSVSPRTAGFNTIPIGELTDVTLLVMIVLMFVGGSPGGTAGGIKTTTLGVLFLSTRALLLGRDEIEFAGRTIPKSTVYRAMALTVIAAAVVGTLFGLLLYVEPGRFVALLFEAMSAFGTVGLSTGITPHLHPAGKAILIVLMYVGRIGPLTLALAIGERPGGRRVHYPPERVLIG